MEDVNYLRVGRGEQKWYPDIVNCWPPMSVCRLVFPGLKGLPGLDLRGCLRSTVDKGTRERGNFVINK